MFGYVDRMFLVALILLVYSAITFAVFEWASRRLTEWMPQGAGGSAFPPLRIDQAVGFVASRPSRRGVARFLLSAGMAPDVTRRPRSFLR